MASVALESFNFPMPDDTMAATLTFRALKPVRPLLLFQNGFALGLISISVKELIQTEALLKLYLVHLHGRLLSIGIAMSVYYL